MAGDPGTLASLPQEVFDLVVASLSRQDRVPLLTVSKAIHALAERSVFRAVSLKSKASFVKFAQQLAARPEFHDAVRLYRVIGDIDRECLDLLGRLTSLRKFLFEPKFRFGAPRDDIKHASSKIASADWITSNLIRCRIRLPFYSDMDIPVEVREQLLSTLFSAPSLEHLTADYTQEWDMDDIYWTFDHEKATNGPTRRPGSSLNLKDTKSTGLQRLDFRWDGLPLSQLSLLLRLPRRLEYLYLRFSVLRAMKIPVADIPLDLALQPVSETLKTLIIEPVDIYESPDCWDDDYYIMEDTGFRWNPRGLQIFTQLETLCLPISAFRRHREMTADTGDEMLLLLPETLTELILIDLHVVITNPGQDPTALGLFMDRDTLEDVCRAVANWEGLRRIRVPQEDDFGLDTMKERPQVYLDNDAKLIVDHDVKIVLGVIGGNTLELETRLKL